MLSISDQPTNQYISGNTTIERSRLLEEMDSNVLLNIFAYALPANAPGLAQSRDYTELREASKLLTPAELKTIGAPDDLNDPVSQEAINLLKPSVFKKNKMLSLFPHIVLKAFKIQVLEPFAQRAVASSPYTTANKLRLLARSPIALTRAAVAKNLNTPPETLKRLSKDKNIDVKQFVASNLNTPTNTIKALAKDRSPLVRAHVAQNLNTPPAILRVLAKDKSPLVRAFVAANRNTPTDTLSDLAKDCSLATLSPAQARLVHTPTNDRVWPVNSFVAGNMSTLPETIVELSEYHSQNYKGILNSPHAPSAYLDRFASSEPLRVAQHKNTLTETLSTLAHHQIPAVRKAVAEHLNTSLVTLLILAHDPDPSVRRAVDTNPHKPADLMVSIDDSEVSIDPHTTPEALLEQSKSPDCLTQIMPALHPNTPLEALVTLAQEDHKLVMYHLVQRSNKPPELLTILSQNLNPSIRKIAAEDLNTPLPSLIDLAQDKDASIQRAATGNRTLQHALRSIPV